MSFFLSRMTPLVFLLLSIPFSASAQAQYDPGDNPPYTAALLATGTGQVLYAHNPDKVVSPASTQKLLLELVVMKAIGKGQFALDDPVYTSKRASAIGGSQVYLEEGEVFTLEEMMEAIAIPSANDACVAVAEHISGSVEAFVKAMNDEASALGLKHTRCVNVHGLDDTPEDNRNQTSAADLLVIARALLDYPKILAWSSVTTKPFRNGRFTLWNTNKLLYNKAFPGMDGLKTGHTDRAGYCLVATAERQGLRLISVIMGSPSEKSRNRETKKLLSWGLSNYTSVQLAEGGTSAGKVALDWGLLDSVEVVIADTVQAVLDRRQKNQLQHNTFLPDEYPAPVEQGEQLGTLKVTVGDSLVARIPLVAATKVPRMTWWEKFMSYF